MSKGGGTTTTTQVADPWSGQQPYLKTGFQDAQQLLNKGGAQYYPGTTYAPATNYQNQGITAEANLGLNGTPLQGAAQNSATDILNGNYVNSDPSTSYYTGLANGSGNIPGLSTLMGYSNGSMLSAQNPYFSQMSDNIAAQVLPQINASFNAGGRADSGLASRAASQGLADSIGGLAYNNYQQGLQQQQGAAGTLAGLSATGAGGLSNAFQTGVGNMVKEGYVAPSINNINFQNVGAVQDAGNQAQQLNQNSINDAVQRWNYNQQLPYNTLNNYMAEIQGNYGGTTTNSQPYYNNMLANGLGGAMLGSSILPGLLGSGAISAGAGAGIGGLGALVMGLL